MTVLQICMFNFSLTNNSDILHHRIVFYVFYDLHVCLDTFNDFLYFLYYAGGGTLIYSPIYLVSAYNIVESFFNPLS